MSEILKHLPAILKELKIMHPIRMMLITACIAMVVLAYRLPDLLTAIK